MHNALTRLQNVFGFFTTVATVVAAVIAALSLVTTPVPPLPSGSLEMTNVQVVKGRPHYYRQKQEEYAHIRFDLDVDLSSLFTWNTKQVFLYVTASYPRSASSPSTQNPNKAIIWDAILAHPLSSPHHNHHRYASSTSAKKPHPTPGILRLPAQRPKYQLTDPSGRLASRGNATLELAWNVQPCVGALTWATASRSTAIRGLGVAGGGDGGWWTSWRRVAGAGGTSRTWDFPAVKNRTEASRAVGGKEALGTEKGTEGNKGRPA